MKGEFEAGRKRRGDGTEGGKSFKMKERCAEWCGGIVKETIIGRYGRLSV